MDLDGVVLETAAPADSGSKEVFFSMEAPRSPIRTLARGAKYSKVLRLSIVYRKHLTFLYDCLMSDELRQSLDQYSGVIAVLANFAQNDLKKGPFISASFSSPFMESPSKSQSGLFDVVNVRKSTKKSRDRDKYKLFSGGNSRFLVFVFTTVDDADSSCFPFFRITESFQPLFTSLCQSHPEVVSSLESDSSEPQFQSQLLTFFSSYDSTLEAILQ